MDRTVLSEKIMSDLLLTQEERRQFHAPDSLGFKIEKMLEAQLAKAEPIIRQKERERILGILQKEYPAIITWRCWQALRGEENEGN